MIQWSIRASFVVHNNKRSFFSSTQFQKRASFKGHNYLNNSYWRLFIARFTKKSSFQSSELKRTSISLKRPRKKLTTFLSALFSYFESFLSKPALFSESILGGCWWFLTFYLGDEVILDILGNHNVWFFTCVPIFSSLAWLEVCQEPPILEVHTSTWRMLNVPDWSLGGWGHLWHHILSA